MMWWCHQHKPVWSVWSVDCTAWPCCACVAGMHRSVSAQPCVWQGLWSQQQALTANAVGSAPLLHGGVRGPGRIACHSGCVHTSSTGLQGATDMLMSSCPVIHCQPAGAGAVGCGLGLGLGAWQVQQSLQSRLLARTHHHAPAQGCCSGWTSGTSSRVCICGVGTACAVLPAQCCAEGMRSPAPTALQQLQLWGPAVLDKAQGWCTVAWACIL